jgi:hypothetical protein
MRVGTGDWIHEGDLVAVVSGKVDAEFDRGLPYALTVGNERTFEQDPVFALRVLADIALRALSPALNDPTSAVQALDWSASLLRTLTTHNPKSSAFPPRTARSASCSCCRPGTTTSASQSMRSLACVRPQRRSGGGSRGCSTDSSRSRRRRGDKPSRPELRRSTAKQDCLRRGHNMEWALAVISLALSSLGGWTAPR